MRLTSAARRSSIRRDSASGGRCHKSMSRLFVTHLEQLAPPAGSALAPPFGSLNVVGEVMDADTYLDLYRAVGAPLRWDERLRMSRNEQDAFLRDPSMSIYVLRHEGDALGLCEFEGVGGRDVELKHFGIVTHAQGKRLGPYLLDTSLRAIWQLRPNRVCLHTDTNDHPKAKSTYERNGFSVFRQAWEDFPD